MNEILGAIGIIGIGAIIFLLLKQKKPAADTSQIRALEQELAQKAMMIGELQEKLTAEKTEKDQLAGRGKQMFADTTKLSAKIEAIEQERDNLKSRLTRLESKEEARQKEVNQEINDLKTTRVGLEEERKRIIREDEEKLEHEREERDRIWNEHENAVISTLTDLCKMPQYAFTSFTNTNLPEGFDGSLKPDFMVEFLDQYIIFDAKASKAKSLQTYINDAVKSTVLKVKKNPKIANSIFLVVPTTAINELKTHHYTHDGYTLYVISPEALPPILASLKRITAYEFAEQLDPQQRENIVSMIADLDFHINLRNGVDLVMTQMGAEILERAEKLDPEITAEVAIKKQEKKIPNFNTSELKKLAASSATQKNLITELVSPKATIRKTDLEALSEKLF